jgi:hypothetical protein
MVARAAGDCICIIYITRGWHPYPWLSMWPWLRWAMVLRPDGWGLGLYKNIIIIIIKYNRK